QDAALGFNVRRNAFIQKFYGELAPVAAAAGVNSYRPGEYIRMSEKMLFHRRRTSLSNCLQFRFQRK
ncbi:MAG: hypothetical protein OET18_11050, partial [Desulfobacterales bacterium]|nr:hypothetical protein [Desulfobacterales bacterium]